MAASLCMRVLSKNIKFHKYLSRSTANFSTNVFKPIPNSSGVLKAANSRGAIRITAKNRILPSTAKVLYSTEAHQDDIIDVEEEYHSIIKDTERSKGPADKHEFQAETRMLLDIVAKSLYSEREVFIRELISNSSDALEKLRYMQMTGVDVVDKDTPLEIHIKVDEEKKTFTIQDTGVGMTKEEMIDNLGTIAKSGTKAFLEQLKDSGSNNNLIGQFGVGFYSAFMVADKVDVFSQSSKEGAQGYKWTSDGYGNYEIAEAENVQRGTKIVMHLKGDSYDYSKEDIIKEVIKKYSNFVGVPIYVNGKKANVLEAVWMKEPKQVSEDMHEEFFRFIANAYDKPRYTLHYKTDAPLNIRALFYVPEYKPTLFDMSRDVDVGITLYSKRVMILNKATNVLPRWLRFVKGVVDSEDIPLNLSRELLQNSALIRKLSSVLTNRVLKFFLDQAKKDPVKYLKFYNDYGLFFREAIVSEPEQQIREDVSKLLRFESSSLPEGEVTGLDDYASRMAAGERNIYYLAAPSRELAMTSPYFEAMQEKNKEVLFCYESYDELVLMNLSQFNNKNLRSVENEVQEDKADTNTVDSNNEDSLSQDEANSLLDWLKITLGNKVQQAKVTQRLVSHPCIITVLEMGSARHFLRTTFAGKSEEEKYRLLQPTLEINPCHPVIKKLYTLKESDPLLAKLVAEQVYDNAMIAAGLVDDPRSMLGRLNEILSKTLEKH